MDPIHAPPSPSPPTYPPPSPPLPSPPLPSPSSFFLPSFPLALEGRPRGGPWRQGGPHDLIGSPACRGHGWQGGLSGHRAPLAAMVSGTRPLASLQGQGEGRRKGGEEEGGRKGRGGKWEERGPGIPPYPSVSKASPTPFLNRATKFWG
jgi:hypothetical protein